MNKVLIVHDYFYLGPISGGPFNSVIQILNYLSSNCEVKILTKCSNDSYINNNFPIITFQKLENFDYNLVILNSFFSLNVLLFVCNFNNAKIIIMPRGELMDNVLKLNFFKYFKKLVFIFLFKILKISFRKEIIFGCTNNFELDIISTKFKKDKKIVIPNVPQIYEISNFEFDKYYEPIEIVNIVYFSRIDRKKNLEFTLELLSKSNRKIEFDIFGDASDKSYYSDLVQVINKFNSDSLKINLKGHVDFSIFKNFSSKYHLFVLHSIGENYSHSIVEMFFLGIPCLISNNTPWKDLSKLGLGWEFSNADIIHHLNIINNIESHCLKLNQTKRKKFLKTLLNKEAFINLNNIFK